MRNIFLIMRREFLVQARKKSFIVITVLAPILLLLAGSAISYVFKADDPISNIAIIDESQLFNNSFKNTDKVFYEYHTSNDSNALKDSLTKTNHLDAILQISKDHKDPLLLNIEDKIKLYSNKTLNQSLLHTLENNINKTIEYNRKLQLGISQSNIDLIKSNISLTSINLINGHTNANTTLKEIISLSLMYIILMFTIIYGTRVMRSIMEEKNNRVVEIIISSVKPFELMLGKILGTTLVALTQFSIWILITLSIIFIGNYLLGDSVIVTPQQNIFHAIFSLETQLQIKEALTNLLDLNIPLIVFIFLFYFFVGYLFYSSFFAAIGAAVDNDTETQQFLPIVVIPLLIGAYGSISIINNPDSHVAFWLSIVPFTAPMVMVTRSFYDIPTGDLLLSMFSMIISVFIMISIAGKIYRIGILIYGKKVTLKEIIKWIKQS
ncbi:ABC transporter permease [Apibacter muscae]|uniref:ABC transporter permease n=1 Tax=Apibacter muscae TaxID=2509004 RepID=UPI0011AC5E5D|nr:ABC transporter permease [Apibacter muscae]TWP30290.1 ABC transporter permease [Apibacter muscae]